MRFDFVFSNPSHHLAMMAPVAKELLARGHATRLVSLAELRGFTSPPSNGVPVVRAIPFAFRANPSVGDTALGEVRAMRRTVVRSLAWRAFLGPRMHSLLAGTRCVIVPNDAAFPYAGIVQSVRRAGAPFVLVQEGIRFPLPNERGGSDVYGRGGAARVCCWGQAAVEHFVAIGVAPSTLCVTGNPRYDSVEGKRTGSDGPLVFLSNPIDDQGFCSHADKLALVSSFVREVAPLGVPITVKLHPREDAAAFREALAPYALARVTEAPLFEVLASARAAVVLASTVGLEALMFGVPLGVLAIPGHGHVFEYVSRNAAAPLELGVGLREAVARLLAGSRSDGADAFVERYLANRGVATARVADAILDAARSAG